MPANDKHPDLYRLAAGVLCVGLDGSIIDSNTQAALRSTPFAGIVLFARNVQTAVQARVLTDTIRECFAGCPPIIAIDQEGGRVARLRDGAVAIPSMMSLAAAGDCDLARLAGEQIAHDLRRIGANLNFAPVLDLATHANSTVIGARAFSDDPECVTAFGRALATGLEAGGIVATFKHFPGHGSTSTDSHLALPVVDAQEHALRSRDLRPFLALLPKARAVMTAHIVMKAFDPERPATLSHRLLTGLLRDEIGFTGVCFTDCMEMDAIAKTVGTAGGAVLALQAGADCVLISHRMELADEAIERIGEAVQAGTLPLRRLEEAFNRVQTLRRSLEEPIPLQSAPRHPQIGVDIAEAAVTQVRGRVPAQGRTVVISFQGVTTEGAQGMHVPGQPSVDATFDMQQRIFPLEPSPQAITTLLDEIFPKYVRVIVLMRRAHLYAAQAAAVHRILQAAPDALLVSMLEPADIECFPAARNVLALYGDDTPNLVALRHIVADEAVARGKLPVRWRAVQ